jgi:hypothetical protein
MADEKLKTEEQLVRISKISKRISRTFRIGEFKSLVIDVNFEEEVSWKDMKERNTKSGNITKLLLKDFQNTTNEVFEELGVGEKKATFKYSSQDLEPTPDPLPDKPVSPEQPSVDVLKELGCDSL